MKNFNEEFRANLGTWFKRANSKEQINQRLSWNKGASELVKQISDNENLPCEVAAEIASIFYRPEIKK